MALSLFISYSHKDQKLLDKFSDHLSSLEFDGVEIWDDREIRAGGSHGWDEQLLLKLNSSDIIVVLLSASYGKSIYCREKELPVAVSRKQKGEALVFFIHLKPWAIPTALLGFQIWPSDTRSIEDEGNLDFAFQKIIKDMRKEIQEFQPLHRLTPLSRVSRVPSDIPYLCDRTEQEEPLHLLHDDTRSQLSRPFVFVLAGPNKECHQAFHERLASDFLPKLFGLRQDASIVPHNFEWPSRQKAGPEAEVSFGFRIKKQLDAPSYDQATITANLPEGLTFLCTTLRSDEWKVDHQELLRLFIAYLDKWPDLPPNRLLCVCVSMIWVERGPGEEEIKAALNPNAFKNLRFSVLPDLQPPLEDHALLWLDHKKVKPWYNWDRQRDSLRDQVRDLFAKRRGGIPMADLKAPLIKILESGQ